MFTIVSTHSNSALLVNPFGEDGALHFTPLKGDQPGDPFILDPKAVEVLVGCIKTHQANIEALKARKRAQARPLGKTQKDFLDAMRRHHGLWHAGCGWRWGSDSVHMRILDSLVLRGLVEVKEEQRWGGIGQSKYTAKTYRLVEEN